MKDLYEGNEAALPTYDTVWVEVRAVREAVTFMLSEDHDCRFRISSLYTIIGSCGIEMGLC